MNREKLRQIVAGLTPEQRDSFRREAARRDLLSFMQYCWWMPQRFVVGRHTREITGRLTRAIEAWERGESTFLCVRVVFGHGKSDMVSRALPAWVLGRLAEQHVDVIMTGYGADLVEGFSRKAQMIVGSEAYRRCFPGVAISARKSSASNWQINGSSGEVVAVGLGGALTGRRGHVIVVDDFCKSREEAESETYRNGIWAAFKDDLMTRRHPAALVVVCATPWHEDDLFGRVRAMMEKEADFPRFEFLTYPAQSDGYDGGYLFPERFSAQWYGTQRATLGSYSAAGLMDCAPVVRGGNMLKVDRVQFVGEMPEGLLWVRFWDLASTAKERVKDGPDYTAGARVAYDEKEGMPILYVDDYAWCQAEAPERDKLILAMVERDGGDCWVGIEQVAGYKDAVTTLERVLAGRAVVHGCVASKDKVVCAGEVEPLFEAGRVVMREAWWREEVVRQLAAFPNGVHDDFVDALTKGFMLARDRWRRVRRFGGVLNMGAVAE